MTEVYWEHDWKRQVVIIPVEDEIYFCARCPICNTYYTQRLDHSGLNEQTGKLNLPQYGCVGPQ